MYELIQISKLNDFIFCPYSLYLHAIYECFKQDLYHETPQKKGKISHENIDSGEYSTSKYILQGISIYSEKYKLVGKIDVYDSKRHYLIERKYKVKQIFDGYKYQLYAEMFCMQERGYIVEKLFIHSLSDNKRYEIEIPNGDEIAKFEELLKMIWEFHPDDRRYSIPKSKCEKCIYKELCEFNQC